MERATDLAIEHFETSLRLTPREQRANPFMEIGVAHFFARRFEEARVTLLRSCKKAEVGTNTPFSRVELRAHGAT